MTRQPDLFNRDLLPHGQPDIQCALVQHDGTRMDVTYLTIVGWRMTAKETPLPVCAGYPADTVTDLDGISYWERKGIIRGWYLFDTTNRKFMHSDLEGEHLSPEQLQAQARGRYARLGAA